MSAPHSAFHSLALFESWSAGAFTSVLRQAGSDGLKDPIFLSG